MKYLTVLCSILFAACVSKSKEVKKEDYIKKGEVIQNIGYDVSANELKNNQTQYFAFDTFSEITLNEAMQVSKS